MIKSLYNSNLKGNKSQQAKQKLVKGLHYQTPYSKKKSRKAKREKQQNSKSYKLKVLLYVIYCIWWAKEHVCPSQTTLGNLIGVNRDTCREYLRELVNMGWLPKWTFRWFNTCIYNVLFVMPTGKLETRRQIAYRFRGVKRPKGFPVPPWLFGMLMANLPKEQGYALLKYGITHESFLKKGYKNKKYTKNQKKQDRKLWKSKFGDPNPYLTKLLIDKYFLNQQKAEFLARNEERVLILAIEDLDTYVSKFGKAIRNYFGFLLNRCKEYGRKVYQERRKRPENLLKTPRDRINWIKQYLTSVQNKVVFIASEKQINRGVVRETTKPGVLLQIHKQNLIKSKLKIFQKLRGAWIDREFTLDHPDFKKVVTKYFEVAFKTSSSQV